MTNLFLKNKRHVTPFEHYISKQIFFSLFFTNHTKKSLSPSRPKNISVPSSKLKFQTRDQQLLYQNAFKADLTTNLTSYSVVKSLVVGLWITMNCWWRLLVTMSGDDGCKVSLVELPLWVWVFFLILWFGFCLGLRCESCDVWLERFGSEKDGWVVMGGAVVDNGCWVTRCSTIYLFFFFLIWGLFGFEVWIM